MKKFHWPAFLIALALASIIVFPVFILGWLSYN